MHVQTIIHTLHTAQCTVHSVQVSETTTWIRPTRSAYGGGERDKRASETPERREERLRVRRERYGARGAIRGANATADATQARLQQLSATQRARRSAESADQRQVRLLQISAAQTERRAAETVAETKARLDGDRERHRAQRRMQPRPSLLEQPVVRYKMCAFHRHLSKLEVEQCITCCEALPGLQLQSLQSAECVRCYWVIPCSGSPH